MKKINFKKIIVGASAGALIFGTLAVASFAAGKPATNNAGSQTVAWNLSGAVMPVPPYGSQDIPGSDSASKLLVNQPNGSVMVGLTGVMNGLKPDTTYTVYVSKTYTPYSAYWDLTGNYTFYINYSGHDYSYAVDLNQSVNYITGTLVDTYLPAAEQTRTVNGTLTGNSFVLEVPYPAGGQWGTRTFDGTIDSTGHLSGTWSDSGTDNASGSWSTTSGTATKVVSGSTGWPGLLPGVQPFTFTTDDTGSGGWHYNLRESVSGLSVWINNSGGTLLISDPITF